MTLRLRLLQGATAALYMGPLLAGLAGYGWMMLPPFVSIFVLWLMILRPHQWPQTNAAWVQRVTWVSVLAQVATQLLLVAVLFGIGRGIGGVLGHLPLFHPLLPVAVSFVAIPMSRLFWNAERALEQGLTIDELMYPVRPPAPAPEAAVQPSPEETIAPLLALPEDAALTEIGPALEDALDDAAAWARLEALVRALDAAPARHAALREALIIWTTDPETFAANPLPQALRAVFRVSGHDPVLLARLLPRAAALARILPERHALFPDRAELDQLAALPLPAQVAADLAALMAALPPRRTPTVSWGREFAMGRRETGMA